MKAFGLSCPTPYRPLMYAMPAQIGATEFWNQAGGQANAGRGVKVAIIDSGVYVTKDAAGNYAGNPCFNDAGYTMPAIRRRRASRTTR